MATPVPNAVSATSSGVPDSQYITDVRRRLKDNPVWLREKQSGDAVNGVNGAGSVPFRVARPPIYDNGTSLYVSVGGTTQTVISTGSPTTNEVFVNYENGELSFSAAPASGSYNLLWSYQAVKWTDASIEGALYAGLREMFPKVGKQYLDTSITIQPLKWDYQLPVWAQSPGSQVLGLEVQNAGISVLPFQPIGSPYWDRLNETTLHLPEAQSYPPNSIVRIAGRGPYVRLSDLPAQNYELPILYACSYLLAIEEANRLRDDRMSAASSEGAHQPGQMTATASYYKKQFDQALLNTERGALGRKKRFVTTYERAKYT